MSNSKLFKKLKEQVEINSIKTNAEIMTESEKAELEKKVIFEGINSDRIENLNIVSESLEK